MTLTTFSNKSCKDDVFDVEDEAVAIIIAVIVREGRKYVCDWNNVIIITKYVKFK